MRTENWGTIFPALNTKPKSVLFRSKPLQEKGSSVTTVGGHTAAFGTFLCHQSHARVDKGECTHPAHPTTTDHPPTHTHSHTTHDLAIAHLSSEQRARREEETQMLGAATFSPKQMAGACTAWCWCGATRWVLLLPWKEAF